MSDPGTKTGHEDATPRDQSQVKEAENPNVSTLSEVTATESTEVVEALRRSQRDRIPTEKGRELQEERLNNLQRRYRMTFERWKYHSRISKETLSDPSASEDELKEVIQNMTKTSSEVTAV